MLITSTAPWARLMKLAQSGYKVGGNMGLVKLSRNVTKQNNFAFRKYVPGNVSETHPVRFLFTTSVNLEEDDQHSPKKLQEADAHAEEQEREHCFSESHFRDTVDRLDAQSHVSLHEIGASNMAASDGSFNTGNNKVDGMSNYEAHQYGSSGSVSLSSVMQSNVPEPFQTSPRGSPSHMNMPGGGVRQQDKYLAGHIKDVHPKRKYSTAAAIAFSTEDDVSNVSVHNDNRYTPFANCQGSLGSGNPILPVEYLAYACPQGIHGEDCHLLFKSGRKTKSEIFLHQDRMIQEVCRQQRKYSTSTNDKPDNDPTSAASSTESVPLSQKEKLKRAVRDYGATVIVFHVTISLMSLGTAYLAVSSGLDVVALLQKIGVGESVLGSRLATGASTFVVAYAVHKVFAPVRIATTLTATPFIVRHLRRIGFLKPMKVKREQ